MTNRSVTGMMKIIHDHLMECVRGWDRFWFVPTGPQTLGVIRVLAGSLILYTHLVWSLELSTFFGSQSVIPPDYRELLAGTKQLVWSHFDWLPSDAWLWPVHILGLVAVLLFTVGLWTRVTAVITALLVISYANRATGALFGLDQINSLLATYLAISPCGGWLSVDSIRKRGHFLAAAPDSVMANIGLRMIQLHMCIVYLFAGMGKLQGSSWWNGEAIWGALATYEYQTLDFVFLAEYSWLVNLLTWSTVAWEASYPFLVWPRLTRPFVLAFAILVHLGIGLAMGMMTFGLAMIIGNLAFIPASCFRPLAPIRAG